MPQGGGAHRRASCPGLYIPCPLIGSATSVVCKGVLNLGSKNIHILSVAEDRHIQGCFVGAVPLKGLE